jgi:hypothetical protein
MVPVSSAGFYLDLASSLFANLTSMEDMEDAA